MIVPLAYIFGIGMLTHMRLTDHYNAGQHSQLLIIQATKKMTLGFGLVTGPGGSGKTVLQICCAKAEASCGEHVLLPASATVSWTTS